jgi:PAS domain S-box-containing protein
VVKVNNDITALKHAEEALRNSEAAARSLFRNAAQGILTVAADGCIADANIMAETLFGYGPGELIGVPVDMLLPEGLRVGHAVQRGEYGRNPRTRSMGQGLNLSARRKDSTEFPVEITLSFMAQNPGVPRGNPGGNPDGMTVAFISDITVRLNAARQREDRISDLEGALAEKVVLIKEVHHRVKNNLAVIGSLLGMQSDNLEDQRGRIALAESQQRVMSMALIHEYLYGTEQPDRVNFGLYVGQLAGELGASYAISPDLVSIDVQAEEIDLSVHRAIPCGLILNEWLSNALKYAFPDGRRGAIRVRFGHGEHGGLILSCGDDGIGIPADFDWQHQRSLGLQIVGILAKQIGGEVTLDREGSGARFELRFPDDTKNVRSS